MGAIISRFRRKKTKVEILEKLQNTIKSIEQEKQDKEQARKKLMTTVLVYSIGLYVLFAVLYYFVYLEKSRHWLQSIVYASPLLVSPIFIIFLRSFISWYYHRSLTKNQIKLAKLKEEKKKILEDVMNTETYKVAKEILDKFGSPDEQSKALKPFVPTPNVPGNAPNPPFPATPGQLRQRQIAMQTSTPISSNRELVPVSAPNNLTYRGPALRSEQLARPLLEKDRTPLEKVVDYLLKDGPNYRMALICSECYSHNGMAMIEEFEYVSYVCAYCRKFNPARKQRPTAPLLSSPNKALPAPRGSITDHGDDSSLGASSGSESDDDNINNLSAIKESGSDTDRPPSALEVTPKSHIEKKQD